MPRRPRHALSGVAFHVMNRAVRGTDLFRVHRDFEAFAEITTEGLKRARSRVRIISFEVMSNHWHEVITCDRIADLSAFMHWTQGTHANRWAGAHRARGRGYVYQGRFKAVPVQTSTSLIRVCRYVERNALRRNLVSAAEHWPWGSLYARCNNCDAIRFHPGQFRNLTIGSNLSMPLRQMRNSPICESGYDVISRSATPTGWSTSRRFLA